MPLRVYNTLSGHKEPFQPLLPDHVGMYVCGVTVYDRCHIGHARVNVAFDMIRRHLTAKGYRVTYVQNYTDIDDKIIERSNLSGIACSELTERFITLFEEDMEQLGVLPPTLRPRATGHIPEIISLVQTLLDKGYAYQADGDVLFSVEQFPGYLKLSGRSLEETRSGDKNDNTHKRHEADFALWKGSKPSEPSWPSPWGPGRPGWHIECSAMSLKHLGAQFDIHGGGKDLIFPHHDNEIAQTQAATGKEPVRYWLHNGFVNINKEKMSKSLGNFFTVREVLEHYDPEVVRLFLLSTHYRSPLDFSDQNLKEAETGLSRIYRTLARAQEALVSRKTGDGSAELEEKLAQFRSQFDQHMDDDFNSAAAIGVIHELVGSLNRCLAAASSEQIGRVFGELARCSRVLGVLDSPACVFADRLAARRNKGVDHAEIDALVAQRAEARSRRDYAESDRIRDLLLQMGVSLHDTPSGTSWVASGSTSNR